MYPGAVYVLNLSNLYIFKWFVTFHLSAQNLKWPAFFLIIMLHQKKKMLRFTERSVNASLDMEQKIKAFHKLFLSWYTGFLNTRRQYNLCYCMEKNLILHCSWPSGYLINFKSLMFFLNLHPHILSPSCHFLALWKQLAANNRKDHSRI